VFATRSPNRPNRIGATVVRLLKVEGTVLTVEGLDAWEGTPVLDIKPDRRRDELALERSEGKD
jgi:tRNA (Thr-GGU) A37 N-methylase